MKKYTITDETRAKIESIISRYKPLSLHYVDQVLPNSYRYAKKCAVVEYTPEKGVVISQGYAKKASYGSAPQFRMRVSPEHVETLKSQGWRLLNAEHSILTF
jgi:hypothetical protein